jgi:hypothetical protein
VVLLVGAVLLGAAWRMAPLPTPPLYEGVVGPAEPYRYRHPPPGLETARPPSAVRTTVAVMGGESPPLDPQTGERPPQAQLLAARGSFVLPPGATSVQATVVPVDPPPVRPRDARLTGNVYDLEVSVRGMPLAVRAGRRVTVVLRGPAGVAAPVIERYAAGRWSRLATQPLGPLAGDSQAADVDRLGEFALVSASGAPAAGGRAGVLLLVVLSATAALVAVATLRGGRRPRRRR